MSTYQYEIANGNGISLSNLKVLGSSTASLSNLIKVIIVLVIIGGILGIAGGLIGYGNTPLMLEVFGGLAILLAFGLFLYGIINVSGAINTTLESSILWHSASVSFQNNTPGTVSWGLSIGALAVGIGGFLVLLAPFIGNAPLSKPLEKSTSPSGTVFTDNRY
jgi:hypothetical protein